MSAARCKYRTYNKRLHDNQIKPPELYFLPSSSLCFAGRMRRVELVASYRKLILNNVTQICEVTQAFS